MPFKRPAPIPHPQSGSLSPSETSSFSLPPAKHARTSHSEKSLSQVKIYIVQAKLDESALSELLNLAERHSERLCEVADEADVIITAIRMRRRLERHIPWTLAKKKAIVTPDWLRDSIDHGEPLPCGDYAALQDLRAETAANCPDCNLSPCACSDSSTSPSKPTTPSGTQTPNSSRRSLASVPPSTPSASVTTSSPKSIKSVASSSKKHQEQQSSSNTASIISFEIPANLLPPDPPIPTNTAKLKFTSRYACQRASPLVCPNSDLVSELDVVRRARALEGEERSQLSYARAISVIKAYPHRITSLNQVAKLPFIGQKIGAMLEEFIDTGKIEESQAISASERFRSLSLFSSIYGIGPNTARKLYTLGLRSLEDLEVYYGVERRTQEKDQLKKKEVVEVEFQKTHRWRGKGGSGGERVRIGAWGGEKGEGDGGLGESWIRIALELREDLAIKIPRDEVEEMGRVIMAELDEFEPGCVSTIVGGYRRGKLESNDVDIVLTHPDGERVKGLCKRFVKRLYDRGMVTHVMHLSGFHGHNPLRTTHWDSLEKSLTVFVLPDSSPFGRGIRRRLDLIFAPPEVYWTAVIGWSGSIMFQRDLRQYAKDKFAMKFDSSGITRRYDSKQFFLKTEKEVFDLFGLEWVDPTLRNADA